MSSPGVPFAAANSQANAAQYATDWFTYFQAFGASLAPGAASQQSLQIQADSSFQLIKLTAFGTLNGGDAPFSMNNEIECNLFITDNGSGRQLMNVPVPFGCIAGTGQLPFILPESRIFKNNSTIQLAVVNFSGANTYNNVGIALCGRKLFKLGS